MKVLLTGATGFLGQHLRKRLEKEEYELVCINSSNCDLTNQDSLHQFNDHKFNKIFHLAAWTQAGDFCLRHPGEQWIINQKINTNIISWWKEYQQDAKFISMGTSCSYDPNLELKEENYLNGTPIDSLFTYAMTKRMMEVGLRSIHNQFDLEYLTVVPSTLYGPGYHTDGRQMHFIFDLITKIIKGQMYDEKVVLWGHGYQKREIVYIDDFLDDLISLDKEAVNDIFNIGAGADFTIRDFASSISKLIGYDESLIHYDESKYIGAEAKFLDTSKTEETIGRLKRVKLNDGLAKTIDWIKENLIS